MAREKGEAGSGGGRREVAKKEEKKVESITIFKKKKEEERSERTKEFEEGKEASLSLRSSALSSLFLSSAMASASLMFRAPMVASTSGSVSQQDSRRASAGFVERRMELECRSAVFLSRRRRPSLVVEAASAPPSSSHAARKDAASASAAVEKQKQQQQLLSNVVPLSSSVVAPSSRSPLDLSKNRTSSAWVPPQAPILSGGGGGVFFFWQLGELEWFPVSEKARIRRVFFEMFGGGDGAPRKKRENVRRCALVRFSTHSIHLPRGALCERCAFFAPLDAPIALALTRLSVTND